MKLIFFGGGDFAATVLTRIAPHHTIPLVVTPPPRPRGRKLSVLPPPAAAAAAALSLPTASGETLPDELRALRPQALIVCDYGLRVPDEALSLAPLGALNIHPSLLPRWRGAAPVPRAILAGDERTGVSIIRLNAVIDGGDILAQEESPIDADDDAGALLARLAEQGADLLLKILAAPEKFPPRPQPETGVTIAKKITAAECQVDFNNSATAIQRQVRALSPRPGASCILGGISFRLYAATTQTDNRNARPGTILSADEKTGLIIACGKGALQINELQRAGKKRMTAAAFLRGNRLAVDSSKH